MQPLTTKQLPTPRRDPPPHPPRPEPHIPPRTRHTLESPPPNPLHLHPLRAAL